MTPSTRPTRAHGFKYDIKTNPRGLLRTEQFMQKKKKIYNGYKDIDIKLV